MNINRRAERCWQRESERKRERIVGEGGDEGCCAGRGAWMGNGEAQDGAAGGENDAVNPTFAVF